MKNNRTVTGAIILSLSVLLAFSQCGTRSDRNETTDLKPLSTFGGLDVAEESVLGSPSDMIVSQAGNIVVSDFQENAIYQFSGEGRFLNKIGRKGSGPGEMQGPRGLDEKGGALLVLESQANRIQYFSPEGEFLKVEPLKVALGMATPLFGYDDDIFLPTGGFRTENLISHYSSGGEDLGAIGRIEGHPFEMYEMLKIRDALIDLSVPDALANQTLLLQTEDRRLFAFHQALPLIKIYAPDGTLERRVELSIPEFPDIFERCSQKNREEKLKGTPSFWGLSFWRDGLVTENGHLLLLLSNPERMTLYLFDSGGRVLRRFLGVEDNISLIAARGSRLWAFGRDSQIFYQFKLDE